MTDRLIQRLPDVLANKIAAGEVVQRPASALKELVENSLDAAAERIDVIVRRAGADLVQVVDDGAGMGRADALVAFERHATSKIREASDLDRLRTLGFRGEALASIASVSQLELRTRRASDEAGTRLRIDGGIAGRPEPVASPPGTSIAARNLFYNVPARRAFLKSPATEFRHIVETFQALALSHPDVAFSLAHDDATVYRLRPDTAPDGTDALAHRIGGLFEFDPGATLVAVREATSYLTLRGYVGRPEHTRRVRGEQFLFVNARVVKNRALDHAVMSAFEGLLPEGTYPFYALFLDLDPAHIDVNVHPSKSEVKFDDERGVYAFVRAVARRALAQADLVPLAAHATDATFAPGTSYGTGGSSGATFGTFDAASSGFNTASDRFGAASGGFDAAHPAFDAASAAFDATHSPFDAASHPVDADAGAGDVAGTGWDAAPNETLFGPSGTAARRGGEAETDGAFLVQLHDAYIVTTIRSGLMIVDQRAAHERVLYERALATLGSGLGLSQQLLFPHTVEPSAPDLALVRELLPDLKALGFDIDVLSGRTLLVRGVPADVRAGDERAVLEDLLVPFRELDAGPRLTRHEALAHAAARRGALRAGQRLSDAEMRTLVDQLFACDRPHVAPDGRPTLVRVTMDELARRFAASRAPMRGDG